MTYSSNSDPDELRREIAKWVPIMPGHFDVAWPENTVDGIMAAINNLIQSNRKTLLSEIEAELPKEKKPAYTKRGKDVYMLGDRGHNDCLTEVKAILKRKKENHEKN